MAEGGLRSSRLESFATLPGLEQYPQRLLASRLVRPAKDIAGGGDGGDCDEWR